MNISKIIELKGVSAKWISLETLAPHATQSVTDQSKITTTTHDVVVYIAKYEEGRRSGTEIPSVTATILMPPVSFTPRIRDKIVINDDMHGVSSIKTIKPKDEILYYDIEISS